MLIHSHCTLCLHYPPNIINNSWTRLINPIVEIPLILLFRDASFVHHALFVVKQDNRLPNGL